MNNEINTEQSTNEQPADKQDVLENLAPPRSDEDSVNAIGTFLNEQELFRAYQTLRGKFTQTCQELSQLKKTEEDKTSLYDYLVSVTTGRTAPAIIGQQTNSAVPINEKRTINQSSELAKTFFSTKL